MRMISRRTAGALLAVVGAWAIAPDALAQDPQSGSDDLQQSVLRIPASRGTSRFPSAATLGSGKSLLVQFPFELKDVLVSDPDKVDAVVQSSNRVFLIAKGSGRDQCLLLRHQGAADPVAGDYASAPTSRVSTPILKRFVPGSNIHAEMAGKAAVLSRHGAHAAGRQARGRYRLPVRRRQQERRHCHQSDGGANSSNVVASSTTPCRAPGRHSIREPDAATGRRLRQRHQARHQPADASRAKSR